VGGAAGLDVDMLTGETRCPDIAKRVNVAFEFGTQKIIGDDHTLNAKRRIDSERKIGGHQLMAAVGR
jgi:hypothetical protein